MLAVFLCMKDHWNSVLISSILLCGIDVIRRIVCLSEFSCRHSLAKFCATTIKTRTPSLSLHFNGRFSGVPGLSSTRMSPFWILLEIRMMEVVVTAGAIRRAKKL